MYVDNCDPIHLGESKGLQLEVGACSLISNNVLRFQVILHFDCGSISIEGFRYDGHTDSILMPSFRCSSGRYSHLVNLRGLWISQLREQIRSKWESMMLA